METLYKWTCHDCKQDGFVSVKPGDSLWTHIIDDHRKQCPECAGVRLSQKPTVPQ